MTSSPATASHAERPISDQAARAALPATAPSPVKVGRILDEDDESFGFEYDDTLGRKNMMRLDALTYEGAVREARSFLGIQRDGHDADGSLWEVE